MAKALVPTVNLFLSAIATRAHAAATHTHDHSHTAVSIIFEYLY